MRGTVISCTGNRSREFINATAASWATGAAADERVACT
jgi:hypothetical protein